MQVTNLLNLNEPMIFILGSGHVGSAIAIDLKGCGYNVISMDLNKSAL